VGAAGREGCIDRWAHRSASVGAADVVGAPVGAAVGGGIGHRHRLENTSLPLKAVTPAVTSRGDISKKGTPARL
jgi:hypothetical protein